MSSYDQDMLGDFLRCNFMYTSCIYACVWRKVGEIQDRSKAFFWNGMRCIESKMLSCTLKHRVRLYKLTEMLSLSISQQQTMKEQKRIENREQKV